MSWALVTYMSAPSHIRRILRPGAVLGFMGTDLSGYALFVHRGGDEGGGAIDAHGLQVLNLCSRRVEAEFCT